MATWRDYHSDPRISYYLYLRHVCCLTALEAHAKVQRMDAMVVGLQIDFLADAWINEGAPSPDISTP